MLTLLTAPGKGQATLIKRCDALNPLAAIDTYFAYDQKGFHGRRLHGRRLRRPSAPNRGREPFEDISPSGRLLS